MALLPPGTASGGDGTTDHNDLAGRDAVNSHPISAITGLQDWLERQDRTLTATGPLRLIYNFTSTTGVTVGLPTPLDTLSLALVMIRTGDGAMIEPEVTYLYGPGPLRYIESVHLGFNPPLSGEHMVYVIR